MAPSELIERLTTAGCRLQADGDRLYVQDPERHLTDELRAAIREHKAELLQLLRAEPANDKPTPCPTCGDPERWPTTRGPVCSTCWLAASVPEPAPAYVKRCAICGGAEWGPSGEHTAAGWEVWCCLTCAKAE